MWRLVTGWVPGRDGQAEAGEAAKTESGEDDGRADCEEGGVGSEEERCVRAGAGKVEERGDGGGEAYTVEMSDVCVYILFFFVYEMLSTILSDFTGV